MPTQISIACVQTFVLLLVRPASCFLLHFCLFLAVLCLFCFHVLFLLLQNDFYFCLVVFFLDFLYFTAIFYSMLFHAVLVFMLLFFIFNICSCFFVVAAFLLLYFVFCCCLLLLMPAFVVVCFLSCRTKATCIECLYAHIY